MWIPKLRSNDEAPALTALSTTTPRNEVLPRRQDIKVERASRSSRGWDVLAVVVVSALAVGLPLVVAWRSGSLSIPHNDDWAYRNVAVSFFETGHLQQFGQSLTTLVGQIFWIWPFLKVFGVFPWVPSLSVAVLAVIGIAAWYSVCRRFLPTRLAVFAVATCVAFPGFALNTTTFMTDIPAWAAEGLCLWTGAVAVQAIRWRRWWLLSLSLAIGCFAFSTPKGATIIGSDG